MRIRPDKRERKALATTTTTTRVRYTNLPLHNDNSCNVLLCNREKFTNNKALNDNNKTTTTTATTTTTPTTIATDLVKDALNRDYLWWSSKNVVCIIIIIEALAIEHYFNDEGELCTS